MNSFRAALRLITDPRQKRKILRRLLAWQRDGLGAKIVRNIQELERFLPADRMRDILMAICACPAFPRLRLCDLEDYFQTECYKHVRSGGAIHGTKPALIGRAVEKDRYALDLRKLRLGGKHFFHTDSQVRDFLLRLLMGAPLTANEKSLLMSLCSAWVTWREERTHLDPFGFAPHMTAVKVRACCGLDPQRRNFGKPILLLVCQCDARLKLYRPTVADAGLHELFQPPLPPEDSHGWTLPWPRESTIPGFNPLSRPEAVHAPAPFALIESTFTKQLS